MGQLSSSPLSAEHEQELMAEIFAMNGDPYRFVMFAFPWGKVGTPLEHHTGPRKWQVEVLKKIRDHINRNRGLLDAGKEPEIFKMAVSSGRGIGKSALVSWLNLWMMSCVPGSTSVTTANTEDQLTSRTFAELGKWHTLAINEHWFEKTALSLKIQPWLDTLFKKQMKLDTKYYYCQAQLWSEEKPDSFAGIHNMNGVMLLMDEAAGIPSQIWDVSEGFFTEPVLHRYWLVFSNPRRNSGAFFECFHKGRAYWNRMQIDSRDVEGTDKKALQSMIERYGADSDQARVEVMGIFPRSGEKQFISRELCDNARDRDIEKDIYAGLIMGVDVARYGDDSSVAFFRRGRDTVSIPPIVIKNIDNMQLSYELASAIDRYKPDAVCIDAGNGTGVIDRLREMGYRIHEVWFGHKSPDDEWANYRTYLWAEMRNWLSGGCIPPFQDLYDDLIAPTFKFQGSSDKIRLETKEEMKLRGLSSPDMGDALACTFAVKVARQDASASTKRHRSRKLEGVDYKIFS